MRRFSRSLAIAAGLAISATVVAPLSAQESNGHKNIIYMIGDGMGYNHVAYNNLYESGQSKNLVDGEFCSEDIKEQEGNSVQSYEDFNRLSPTNYFLGGSYDPVQAWAVREDVRTG